MNPQKMSNKFGRPSRMEPMFPGENKALSELAMKVYADSSQLSGMVHPITRKEIARLLRHINSYYSNRIEGEHTTPEDIEKAVKKEYNKDEKKKRLQQYRRADNTLPDERILRPEAKYVLTEVMIRGEIARGEVPRLIGMGERTATDLIRQL